MAPIQIVHWQRDHFDLIRTHCLMNDCCACFVVPPISLLISVSEQMIKQDFCLLSLDGRELRSKLIADHFAKIFFSFLPG